MTAAETNGDLVWVRDGENSSQDDVWDDSALIDAYDRAVGQVKEEIEKRKTDSNGAKKKTSKNLNKPTKPNVWKVGDYCNTIYPEDGEYYEAYVVEISESGENCVVQFLGYANQIATSILALKPSLGKAAREKQEKDFQDTNIDGGPSSASMDWANNAGATGGQNSFAETRRKSHHETKKSPSPSPNNHNSQPIRNSSSRQSCHSVSSSSSHHHHQSPCGPGLRNSSSAPPMPHYFQPPTPPPHPQPPMSWPGTCFNNPVTTHMHQQRLQTCPPIPPPPAFPLDQDIVNDEEALAAMLMSWYMSGYHTGYYQGLRQTQNSKCQKYPPMCNCCQHSSKR